MLVLRGHLLDHQGIPVRNRIVVRIHGIVGDVIVDVALLVLEVLAAGRHAGVVPLGLVLELHETGDAHLLRMRRPAHQGEAAVVVDVELAGLRTLGRDKEDAGGSAGTVNGGGGRILQDGDVFDRIDIHVIEAGDRDAVHDDERVGVADGGDTADADGRARAREAAGTRDLDARHRALERLGKARGLDGGDLAAVHRGDGTGQVFLLDRTVADDHDLVKDRAVLLQDDIDPGTGSDRDHFRDKTHERNLQGGLGRGYRQGIIAVDIRYRAVQRPRFEDAGTSDGLSALVKNGSGDLDRLRGERQESQAQSHEG